MEEKLIADLINDLKKTFGAYMGIYRSPLPQNNGNLPLPFLVVITLLLSWIISINDRIYILIGPSGKYFLMIVYVIQKLGVTRILQILST